MRRRYRDNATDWGPLHSLTSATISLCTVAYYCLGPPPPPLPQPPTSLPPPTQSMLEPRWRPVQVQYITLPFPVAERGWVLGRPPPRRIAPSPCQRSSYRPRGSRLIVASLTSIITHFFLFFFIFSCFFPLHFFRQSNI